MELNSINPYTNRIIGRYTVQTETEIATLLNNAQNAFKQWRETPLNQRTRLIKKTEEILRNNVEKYALMITHEMGKPITESRAEVNKCAWLCAYYAENASKFLADEMIPTEAQKSFVQHEPIGCILAIMPWNFPFWQVFRCAVPAITSGNVVMLKHAPNVLGCAQQIEDIFIQAGFPEGVFKNLIIHHDSTEKLIAHDTIKAVTLTGSERAGSAVAETAGRHIKKTVLELGGNNAFIVWEDADIDQAVKTALTARMLNCGQSCIAAKRFILLEPVYDEFLSRFTEAVKKLKLGNPVDEKTQIGPLARKDLADRLQKQVKITVEQGAQLILGGTQKECCHEPTILSNVLPGMPAFDEETFGPLAALTKAQNKIEAFKLANLSKYGLGITVCTADIEKAMAMSSYVSDGAYFINELVKSDPRLPFGGTKRSGYGRELGKDGMMEFINRKTVYVK